MADDVERHLTDAAGALREHQVTARRYADLGERLAGVAAQLSRLRAQLADEVQDVERLEGLSLTRVLASLRGSRDDALARERAEAEVVRLKVAEAEARHEALHRERAVERERLARLDHAPATYAAALDGKERYLRESGDPRGRQLLDIADERGRLRAELREVAEAVTAADEASSALRLVQDKLGSASSWSTYDTYLGGGPLSSSVKHHRLDEAAGAAALADRCLGVLRTELADVPGMGLTAPQLAVDGVTRFLDVWLDNVFTDVKVGDQIRRALENVERSLQVVSEVRDALERRAVSARTRIDALTAQRQAIITG